MPICLRHRSVRRDLIPASHGCPRVLRKKLAPYVASTDRQSQAYWPIIKRICLRSSNWKVLEQGGILVDLPGLRGTRARVP